MLWRRYSHPSAHIPTHRFIIMLYGEKLWFNLCSVYSYTFNQVDFLLLSNYPQSRFFSSMSWILKKLFHGSHQLRIFLNFCKAQTPIVIKAGLIFEPSLQPRQILLHKKTGHFIFLDSQQQNCFSTPETGYWTFNDINSVLSIVRRQLNTRLLTWRRCW